MRRIAILLRFIIKRLALMSGCPWNIQHIIQKYCHPSVVLVDIGCGTGERVLPLRNRVKQLICIEPDPSSRQKMRDRIERGGISNVSVVDGQASNLPLDDSSADIVTVMEAPHDRREMVRVLRPGGTVILEKIGERDKHALKECFGSDADGPRGYLFSLPSGARRQMLRSEFSNYFKAVRVEEGIWDAFVTRDELTRALQEFHIVRGFSAQADGHVLDRYERRFQSAKGIRLELHRILVVANHNLKGDSQ